MNPRPACAFFGGLLLDRYHELDAYPPRGGDAVILDEYELVGGCAVNMAAAFHNLGGEAHIVASLGRGPIAGRIRAYLEEHGLSLRFIGPAGGDAGYCYVFLEPDGERTFLTRDSLGPFPAEQVNSGLSDMDGAALTGYYLLDEPEAVADCVCAFADGGGRLLYDPGPMLHRLDPGAQARVLQAASIVTMNREEAARSGFRPRPEQIFVVKMGEEGGRVFHGGRVFDYPAVPAETVDSTGAGDAFDGGLLFGLCSGRSLEDSVALAARCAARTVGIRGPHGFWKGEDL